MPTKPTILFLLSGIATLYFVAGLIGGFGYWSILLVAALLFVTAGLWKPALAPAAKGICGATSAITGLFIVMSLIGSTIGSGMSPEFKPLFGCFLALSISGFIVARGTGGKNPDEAASQTGD